MNRGLNGELNVDVMVLLPVIFPSESDIGSADIMAHLLRVLLGEYEP
jgi:hypothetical protein